MQIHKQSSYFFIILYNNIKQHGRKQRVDIKNAVLRGLSYEEGATTRTRNGQIGGHKA